MPTLKHWLDLIGGAFDLRKLLTELVPIAAVGALLLKKLKHAWKTRQLGRDPSTIWIEDLVPDTSLRKATGPQLMLAINEGAIRMIRGSPESSAKLKDLDRLSVAWEKKTTFDKHKSVADSFVTPACSIGGTASTKPRTEQDALKVLRDWLTNVDPQKKLHVEVRGDGGVGKTSLLNQLFLTLAESKDAPVPMLASASNIEYNSGNLRRLCDSTNPLQTFVEVWLKVRGITAKTKDHRIAAYKAIRTGLSDGSIALLFDGVDEFGAKAPGAEQVVNGWLAAVSCSIVTERYEPTCKRPTTNHIITLPPAWDEKRIEKYATLRLKGSANTARQLAVLAQEWPSKDWLTNPDYLTTYLDSIKPLSDEIEMHHLAASRGGVIEAMLQRALSDAPGHSPAEARSALSAVALADAGDPRTNPEELVEEKSDEGRLAAKLKTMTRVVQRGGRNVVAFQHVAAREYFLALEIARELLSGPSEWPYAKALRRVLGETWGLSRIEGVSDALTGFVDDLQSRQTVGDWLKTRDPFGAEASPMLVARAKRNLLELLILLAPKSNVDSPSEPPILHSLDLSGIDGRGLNLASGKIEGCSFVKADLCESDMAYAHFIRCTFAGADLCRVNAVRSVWDQCDFGKGDNACKVQDMEVNGTSFTPDVVDGEIMPGRNVRRSRSRYFGPFGERFLKYQHTFLGLAVNNLEAAVYVPSIREAILDAMDRHPEGPLILVDLMAGGSPQRTNELLADFPRLHVLSIDRDAPLMVLRDRHKWDQLEFDEARVRDGTSVDPFSLGKVLRSAFGEEATGAHVIIAKKALHELDCNLQKLLIKSCASTLHPGGRLVLFEDVPGPETGPFDGVAHQPGLQRHEELRNLLLDRQTTPDKVRHFIEATPYRADAEGEWAFVNDWVAIKDWANGNEHEVQNRYFASLAELCSWAEPDFDFTLGGKPDYYDINPLRFNERGVNAVLHYLARLDQDRREKTGDANAEDDNAIDRDKVLLLKMLVASPNYRVLVDITRMVFARSTALASHMKMTEQRVGFEDGDPLKPLQMGETAPDFKLRCAVVVLTRRVLSSQVTPLFAVGKTQPTEQFGIPGALAGT